MGIADESQTFADWVRKDRPTPDQIAAARLWIDGLLADPRQPPSQIVSPDFPRAHGELRATFLFDADTFIVHDVEEAAQPRLLYIGRSAPQGITFTPWSAPPG